MGFILKGLEFFIVFDGCIGVVFVMEKYVLVCYLEMDNLICE